MRSSKAYYLRQHPQQDGSGSSGTNSSSSSSDLGKPVKKIRSIERKYHHVLTEKTFSQDPRLNSGVVRGNRMGPSAGYQILVTTQGKALSNTFNLTRVQQVSDYCGW